MKLVGIERIDYVRKEDGRRVIGTNLHCCYESNKVEGNAVLKPIYCGSKVDTTALSVGDEINIYYDSWNKPSFIEIIGKGG